MERKPVPTLRGVVHRLPLFGLHVGNIANSSAVGNLANTPARNVYSWVPQTLDARVYP